MNVVFGDEVAKAIEDKYTLLELDTLFIKEGIDPMTNYAAIGPGDIPFDNFVKLKHIIPLHEGLIRNYKEQNWDICLQLLEELHGSVDPFMDSFYEILLSRITKQMADPTNDWTPIVDVS